MEDQLKPCCGTKAKALKNGRVKINYRYGIEALLLFLQRVWLNLETGNKKVLFHRSQVKLYARRWSCKWKCLCMSQISATDREAFHRGPEWPRHPANSCASSTSPSCMCGALARCCPRHLSGMLTGWTKCLFNPSVLATFWLTRFCLHVTETGHNEEPRVKGLAQEPRRCSLSSCDLSSQSTMVQYPSVTEMMTWMAKTSQTRAECSAETNNHAWS